MQTQKHAPPFLTGEPFQQLVAILIALVTIIASLAGFLNADASARSGRAGQDAQRFALQAIGERARGEVQVGFAWADAYRLWLEQDRLTGVARSQQQQPLADAYLHVRDQLSEINPLLSPFYFDPAEDEFPNVNAYEADLYLKESTILGEHFVNSSNLSAGWGEKSASYVKQITLLTVTLFLYGLSTTIIGRVSWLFIGMGTLLASIALLWMVMTVMIPVHTLPNSAIAAYATGVGLAFQGQHEQAIAAFDESIKVAPAYANAYFERAKAKARLDQLAQAAEDYTTAQKSGRNDAFVAWNLGWSYYLLGRFDQAEEATTTALTALPNQVMVRFNLALIQLAAGKIESAQSTYTQAMTAAIQQVSNAKVAGTEPPATLWWYLNAAALDLDHLLRCLQSNPNDTIETLNALCKQAPTRSAISDTESITRSARATRQQLKNLATALELTGSPPPPASRAQVEALAFVEPNYSEGDKLEYVPVGTQTTALRGAAVYENAGRAGDLAISRHADSRAVFVAFTYRNFKVGQWVVVKVYTNGVESSGLRLTQQWSLGGAGEAILPLTPGGSYTLQPGEYRVELYVDSNLLQEGAFVVQ